MQPDWFEVQHHDGTYRTFRTCGGPVGAFHASTGERPTEWVYLNDRETMVNGCLVRRLSLRMG